MPQGSLALYRRHLGSCPHVAKGNRWTPVPLSNLGPGVDRRRADPTQSQHHQLDRRLLGRASMAGRRTDWRPQARDPDHRRGSREVPRRSRRPEPACNDDSEAPGTPSRQAPALLRATRLSPPARARPSRRSGRSGRRGPTRPSPRSSASSICGRSCASATRPPGLRRTPRWRCGRPR